MFPKITKIYQKQLEQSKKDVKPSKKDRVNLSREGYELKRIYQILSQTPNIRLDKVDQLKSAIQQGSYEIHEDKIAEKMIEGHLIDQII